MNSGNKYHSDEKQELSGVSKKKIENSTPFQVSKVVDNISGIFISLDHHWKIKYGNQQAQALIGNPKDYLGKDLIKILSQKRFGSLKEYLFSFKNSTDISECDFYDTQNEAWYHLRIIPSDEGFYIFIDNITSEKKNIAGFKGYKRAPSIFCQSYF